MGGNGALRGLVIREQCGNRFLVRYDSADRDRDRGTRLVDPPLGGPLGSGLNHIHQMTMAARITAAAKLLASLS